MSVSKSSTIEDRTPVTATPMRVAFHQWAPERVPDGLTATSSIRLAACSAAASPSPTPPLSTRRSGRPPPRFRSGPPPRRYGALASWTRFRELLERDQQRLARAHHRRTRQGGVRRGRRGAARHRGGRVRHRHSAAAQGRVHRGSRHRRRQLFDAPAARRRGRHHPVQLPGDGAAVDVPGGAGLRQHLHPEAERERPVDGHTSWPPC